ncbi:MAG: agmatine/peptidylarginine deiminase [Acidimicrobiales bacterium]
MTSAAPTSTPADSGFRMPPETAPHERMLMAWPCRRELWGSELAAARHAYAEVANAVAAFEPVTMVVPDEAAADGARALLAGGVDLVELPIDDSWMRDSGPIFALDTAGRRAGVHFRFNAWGEKFAGWDRDEAAGGVLAELYGDVAFEAPIVLEGGSILVDERGHLVTTEQCLLAPNRNPELDRSAIEDALRSYLGVTGVVWLGRGLVDDRDTDGHVDGIATFNDAGQLLLQSRPPGDPDHETMAENRERAIAAGLDVVTFPPLAYGEVADTRVPNAYLNLTPCNGGVIVPLAGGSSADEDEEALEHLAAAFPGREVVGVPGLVIAYGGGGPHCITQQVPTRVGTS